MELLELRVLREHVGGHVVQHATLEPTRHDEHLHVRDADGRAAGERAFYLFLHAGGPRCDRAFDERGTATLQLLRVGDPERGGYGVTEVFTGGEQGVQAERLPLVAREEAVLSSDIAEDGVRLTDRRL